MKKLSTSLLFSLSLGFVCYGQALFVQDFENGIEPMKLYDEDGRTPHANVGIYTEAWNVTNPAFGNGTEVAISNSWYDPAGLADDWMVTPAIMIEEGTIVRWEAKAQDPSFRDGYQVLVSTATDAVADFTNVEFQTGGEETSWTTRQVDLTSYAGQQIYIAWRNNSNDKFLLLVDNIFVGIPKPNDVRILNADANINNGTALEGERNLIISFSNMGNNDVTSVSASYSLNGGEVQTTDVSDLTIPPGGSYSFSHPEVLNFEVGEMQDLVFSIDLVNGVQDTDQTVAIIEDFKVFPPIPNFDLVTSKGDNVNLYDVLTSPKAVVLDFFASWCGPCEFSTPELNSFFVDNGAGDGNLMVLGLDIEPTDDDNVVNNLGWGATYPKFSYSQTMEEFWTHFNLNHGLGESAIPFFVMICPDPENPGYSEITTSAVGFQSGMFTTDFQPDYDECAAGLTVSVKEISSLTDSKVFPNPVNGQLNLEFGLQSSADIRSQVINQLGEVVLDLGVQRFFDGENKLTIETSDFANGIYYLRMNKGTEISTFKFSVAH